MGLLDSRYRPEFNEGESKRVDWWLFLTIIILALVGAATVHSATSDPNTARNILLTKQLIFLGIGLFSIIIILLFDYRILDHFAYIIYAANFIMLVGTRFFGVMKNGARLWYNFGFMSYQPSETMKLAMILALAKYFHEREFPDSLGIQELIVPGLIVAVPTITTIAQPDLGTGFHMGLIGMTIIMFFGVKKRIIFTCLAAFLISLPVMWKFGFKEYQRNRVRVMFDPSRDSAKTGYNSMQALIAVGSGEFMGKGYLKGTQTQLGFTPEGYTDFIFTVLAEEWGWVGSLLFLSLYVFLIYRCIWAAAYSREKFGALVAIGIAALISYQCIINLAMVIGLFPVVGIPLPLASYGGSSVVTICAALGLVLNIGYRRIIF